MIASSQSFSMIHRRIPLSPEPAPPVKSGEPEKTRRQTRPVFLLCRPHGFELTDHVLQEQQRTIVHAWQSGAEPAVIAARLVLLLDVFLLLLPIDAERRVRQEVVERFSLESVLGEGVAKADVVATAVVIDLLDEHVRCGCGVCARVVVLAVGVKTGRRMVLPQIILRFREHASGSAGRVEQLANRAGRRQQIVILDEEDVHHEPDDFTRCEVIAGRFVRQLIEAPDEVLEDESHLLVRHLVGMKIDLRELGDDQIEDARVAHLRDLGIELEEVEDATDVRGETLDVKRKVFLNLIGIALQPLEIQFRMVVKPLSRCFVQRRVERLTLELPADLCISAKHGALCWCEH